MHNSFRYRKKKLSLSLSISISFSHYDESMIQYYSLGSSTAAVPPPVIFVCTRFDADDPDDPDDPDMTLMTLLTLGNDAGGHDTRGTVIMTL